jgi:hypothetical protein
MRERIAQALADLENIRETLTQIGLPDEDPDTGVATHELAEALNHVGALESLKRPVVPESRRTWVGGLVRQIDLLTGGKPPYERRRERPTHQ